MRNGRLNRVSAIATLLVMGFMIFGGSATAQRRDRDKVSEMDIRFVMEAAAVNVMEVDLGRLAMKKGSSGVRQFGERMVEDHTKAQQELMRLASSKGIEIPKDMDAMEKKLAAMNLRHLLVMHMETKEMLTKLSDLMFDKAYIGAMVKGHAMTVAAFELEYGRTKDPDLRAWVNKTLPILRQHKQLARELAEMLVR